MKKTRAMAVGERAEIYLATEVEAHLAALQAQHAEALAEKDREIARVTAFADSVRCPSCTPRMLEVGELRAKIRALEMRIGSDGLYEPDDYE